MLRFIVRLPVATLAFTMLAGCGSREEPIEPEETFHWVTQEICFSPPPANQWERQGDNGGGTLGVRFILTGGGGQCIGVAAYSQLAARDRRDALLKLIAHRDSLTKREFLRELSLARAPTDDPLSAPDAAVALAINTAINRAMEHYLADSPRVEFDLEAALRAAESYEPTLEDVLPRIRLQPERMNEPERWRVGYERDTTLAGHPAFASDDTLFTPERPLLYREIFWVVKGCAFKASYQGTYENLPAFYRLVDSIRFPEDADASSS